MDLFVFGFGCRTLKQGDGHWDTRRDPQANGARPENAHLYVVYVPRQYNGHRRRGAADQAQATCQRRASAAERKVQPEKQHSGDDNVLIMAVSWASCIICCTCDQVQQSSKPATDDHQRPSCCVHQAATATFPRTIKSPSETHICLTNILVI